MMKACFQVEDPGILVLMDAVGLCMLLGVWLFLGILCVSRRLYFLVDLFGHCWRCLLYSVTL